MSGRPDTIASVCILLTPRAGRTVLTISPAIVPITVLPATSARQDVSANPHPSYSGSVFFRNTFDGKLPASDYPKVNVSAQFPHGILRLNAAFVVLLLDVPCVLRARHCVGMALLPERARPPSDPGESLHISEEGYV